MNGELFKATKARRNTMLKPRRHGGTKKHGKFSSLIIPVILRVESASVVYCLGMNGNNGQLTVVS